MKIRIGLIQETAVLLALSMGAVIASQLWQASPFRITLGLVYVLFLPGYALLAALFPGREDIPAAQRAILSFVSSPALVSLIALLLNWTPWGVNLVPILASTTSFIVLVGAVAGLRRSRLPPADRFVPRIEIPLPSWSSMSLMNKTLTTGLTLSVILGVGTLVYLVIHPKVTERYTEFYLLGPNHSLDEYPVEAIEGQPISLVLGMVNHEHETVQYRVIRDISGREQTEMERIELAHGAKWEEAVVFALRLDGDSGAACSLETLSFLLYKDGETEPYRTVYLEVALLPDDSPSVSPTPVPQPSRTTAPEKSPSPSATGTSAPEPTHSPAVGQIHVVQPGETLSSISRQYGVTLEDLIRANALSDPGLLEVGQEMIIPPSNDD